MRVVVAPDKFKGSLTAPEVARHVAAGLARAAPGLDIRLAPVADGGDGTVDAAVAAGFERRTTTVAGPTGAPVQASYAVRSGTAVVELSEASGLRRLPGGRLAALTASSTGTGELIRAALDAGCRRVVLGIGGSASTDGGAGMLQALGARLLDTAGHDLHGGGAALRDLATVDLSGLDPRLHDTEVVVASDVDNPLLGPHGAAAVYGPQKGAGPDDVRLLDAALAHWAALLQRATGLDVAAAPGAGAAGGVGYAALAALAARLLPGIELMLDLVGFADLVPGARLVVTGEGSLDAQSLHGKAPVGVATAAGRAGVPVVAVAGRTTLTPEELSAGGIAAAYALTDLEPDVDRCIADAGPLLETLAARVAADWLGAGS